MSNLRSSTQEPLIRWLVEPEPKLGTIGINVGIGFARFQIRTLIGFTRSKDGTCCYHYSPWEDIIVESPAIPITEIILGAPSA